MCTHCKIIPIFKLFHTATCFFYQGKLNAYAIAVFDDISRAITNILFSFIICVFISFKYRVMIKNNEVIDMPKSILNWYRWETTYNC